MPALRKLSKELYKSGIGEEFIKKLPHVYYEEDNIHAFIVEQIMDFDTALAETEKFLPFIDNWATCDMFSPKVFADYPDEILAKSIEWINSDKAYTSRYGIGMLMRYFLDDNFTSDILSIVASVRSEQYYVNMMVAWFFATALAKQYEKTVIYLEKRLLPDWVHNKTIQKAVESNRISSETKEYLKKLKIKTPV